MITKFQDISNKVAQAKIGDSRLRNEEIRRQMAMPWTQPTLQDTTYNPIQSIQNPNQFVTTPSQLGNVFASDTDGTNFGGNPGFSKNDVSSAVMGALPGMATTGAGMLGAGPASGLAGAAVSGLQGNIGGAVQGIGSTIGALAGLKGYSGLVGQLAKDAYKDVDMDTMMGNLGKQAALSAIFGAVPGLGVAYSLASLFGLDMEQGLRDTFSGYQGAPGFQGTLGGFFGKNALGLGVGMPGPNDTPLGFETSDLGTGIFGELGSMFGPTDTTAPGFSTSDLGTGLTGSLSGQFGNWGTSDFGEFGGDSRGETGDVAGSGTGNSGNAAEGMGGPDGPAGEGDGGGEGSEGGGDGAN